VRRKELMQSDRLSEFLLLVSGIVVFLFLMMIVIAALTGRGGTT